MLILIGILLFCVCYPVLYVICGAAEYWHLVLGIFLCGTGFIGLFTENKDGPARLLSFLLFMSLGAFCIVGEPTISEQYGHAGKHAIGGAVASIGIIILLKANWLVKIIGLIVLLMGGLLLVTI